MIKVRSAPGFSAKKSSPSLREWAAKHRLTLVDPDVEEAIAAAHISYEDERVPYAGVGPGPAPIEEGWVAVEDPAFGGFAIGYVWLSQQVRAGVVGRVFVCVVVVVVVVLVAVRWWGGLLIRVDPAAGWLLGKQSAPSSNHSPPKPTTQLPSKSALHRAT